MQKLTERGVGLLARALRGIEWVAAAELEGRLGANIIGIGHREIRFELPNLNLDVLKIRCADDVFLSCGSIEGLDHRRDSLRLLSQQSEKLDFVEALARLERVRLTCHPDRFDVVASFLGRRNYNRFEIEAAVGEVIARQIGAVQQPHNQRSRSDISWRVHLRDHEAYIGLRISNAPLHRRGYKVASQVGTLHPPLASAMALISGLRPKGVFFDPFCGVGTIGIEAKSLEPEIIPLAGDIEASTVRLAQHNGKLAGCRLNFVVADAGRMPIGYRSVDRVACNMPWGRTVGQEGDLATDPTLFWREIRRILHSEGRAVILSESAEPGNDQIREAQLQLVLQFKVSLFGRWPVLSVVVPDSQRNSFPIDEYGKFGPELVKSISCREDL